MFLYRPGLNVLLYTEGAGGRCHGRSGQVYTRIYEEIDRSNGQGDRGILDYHDDFYSYTTRLEKYRDALQDTERKRKEYVEAEMFRFDRQVRMAAEDKQWKWSSLFCAFSTSPEPACMTRPFHHIEEEFQILLAWMAEQGINIKTRNEPHVIARAFKLFMRSEYGGRVPLLCPV